MSDLILTEDNFDQEVLQSPIPVLVDFWAEWCGPCKVVSPIVSELGQQYKDQLKVGKLNVDDYNAVSMRYNIMSIPTLKIFKGGKQVGEVIGAAPKSTLEAEIKRHI